MAIVSRHDWAWAPGCEAHAAWCAWAQSVAHWLRSESLSARDVVVLLPQVALLAPARRAWADTVAGWLPRMETVGTLQEGMPRLAPEASAVGLTLDTTVDTLLVGQAVVQSAAGRAWRRRDPAGADFALQTVVAVAHDWLRVALAKSPADRAAWLAAAAVGGTFGDRAIDGATDQADKAAGLSEGDKEGDKADAEALGSFDGRVARTSLALAEGQVGGHPRGTAAPGSTEDLMLALALAWGQASLPSLAPARDALFALCSQPQVALAWVAVTVGTEHVPGSDSALMLALLGRAQQAGMAALWTPACLDASCHRAADDGAQALAVRGLSSPQLYEAAHGAEEAEVSAALVLEAVRRARAKASKAEHERAPEPVALLAQDRMLTRRVRALLAPHERSGALVLSDESGWTLSTTRAAAAVSRLLLAARPQATADEVLDWLVGGWCQGSPGGYRAIGATEALWRKLGCQHPWLEVLTWPEGHPGQPLLAWAQHALSGVRTLAGGGRFSLAEGLDALAQALCETGAWATLQTDPAGQAVLLALHLHEVPSDPLAEAADPPVGWWVALCQRTRMGFDEFSRWVDQAFEAASFMPPPAQAPDVVITPLSRAVLRTFSEVVVPGVDEQQLGRRPSPAWLAPLQAAPLGLGTPEQQQASQWAAWALLACHPRLVALYTRTRDGEPLAPSPWLGRWLQAVGAGPEQADWPRLNDPRQVWAAKAHAQRMPAPALMAAPTHATPGAAPAAGDALAPWQITATGYEQLRACPYRYFARSLLGLAPQGELEDGLTASDLGDWLHEVLLAFHAAESATPVSDATAARRATGSAAPAPPASHGDVDLARFVRLGHEVATRHGLASASRRAYFMLWAVTLPRVAEHYLRWWRRAQSQGWQVHALEHRVDLHLPLPKVPGQPSLRMYGDLDRVDRVGHPAPPRRATPGRATKAVMAGDDGAPATATSSGGERSQNTTLWRVMDYKTGALKPLQERAMTPQEDTQLAFYAALAEPWLAGAGQTGAPDHHQTEMGLGGALEALYLRVADKDTVEVPHPDARDSAMQLKQGLQSDMQAIWLGQGMPALGEGALCGYCDVRGLCRKDHWADQALAAGAAND